MWSLARNLCVSACVIAACCSASVNRLLLQLVVWLPALCRKLGVPYAIVNNKGRLGTLVGKKTAAAVAIATKDVKPEDRAAFQKLVDNAKEHNDRDASTRRWGGGVMGLKTQRRLHQRAAAIAAEAAKKAML